MRGEPSVRRFLLTRPTAVAAADADAADADTAAAVADDDDDDDDHDHDSDAADSNEHVDDVVFVPHAAAADDTVLQAGPW